MGGYQTEIQVKYMVGGQAISFYLSRFTLFDIQNL